MNLYHYGDGGLCVQYQCVQCDRTNLIDEREFVAGRYYNCSFCHHQWQASVRHWNVVAAQAIEAGARKEISRPSGT